MPAENFIHTNSALCRLMARAENIDAIALDTEFVWERTYYPRLGLIQLALSNEECFLIDPLATQDLRPLGKLLANDNVVKIFHDAPQDLAILARATQATPQNIFDTRLAAGFAELPATISLANLSEQLLEIPLDKSSTRTNWLQRPLTEKQLLYAEDDVRYLRAIRVLLLSKIVTPEMKEWLQEEMERFNNPETYNFFDITTRYKKIRGHQHLDAQGLSLVKKLSLWREQVAQAKDRPRNHIIPDAVLLEIAQNRPQECTMLGEKTSISPKAYKNYGTAIVEIIQQASEEKHTFVEKVKKKKLTPTEKATLNSLNKYILLKSDLLGLDPALIGNSAELKHFARLVVKNKIDDTIRQNRGWRKKFLADFLA